ncbi:MAG: hydrogenase small subunit [Desulfuromonadales bacterium]
MAWNEAPARQGVPEEILRRWERKGVSRRQFLQFCTGVAATLALPASFIPKIAEGLETDRRLPVIWLSFQACTGDGEALIRAYHPPIDNLLLDVISLEYMDLIMAAAGHQAEAALNQAVGKHAGRYVVLVDGEIPLADKGYCTIGGMSALEVARTLCSRAAANVAVGTCASYGGIQHAAPNPTGAAPLADAVPEAGNVVRLPGCPCNTENLTATLVHYVTFGRMPEVDLLGRPKFAYGMRIHDHCQRRGHFDAGQYAAEFGGREHRLGYCLYKLGCKGPETFHNCPSFEYNEETSWPVEAGHGCIGCSEPVFWDTMTPFYLRLPNVPGFGIETTADKVGIGLAAATAAAFAAHGVASAFRKKDRMEAEKVKKED